MFAKDTNTIILATPKITTAELTRHLNFTQTEIIEVESIEKGISIEQIRNLKSQLGVSANPSTGRLIIIWDCHFLSSAAMQTLLKLIEEPPTYTQLVLTTPLPHALPETILSRANIKRINSVHNASSDQDLAQLYSNSIGECIKLAEAKGKDRESAIQFVLELCKQLTSIVRQYPSPQLISNLKNCIRAHERLNRNLNTRLVLEDLFFKLRKTKTNPA